jgi:hypothetical protein
MRTPSRQVFVGVENIHNLKIHRFGGICEVIYLGWFNHGQSVLPIQLLDEKSPTFMNIHCPLVQQDRGGGPVDLPDDHGTTSTDVLDHNRVIAGSP